jgi:hypothetical protein
VSSCQDLEINRSFIAGFALVHAGQCTPIQISLSNHRSVSTFISAMIGARFMPQAKHFEASAWVSLVITIFRHGSSRSDANR